MACTGRPRKFSEESSLDASMMVCWQEGYHASSVAQLCSAMQLKAPSLYATFGDKESLFLKSLDRYFEVYGAGPRAALQHPDLGLAIAGFFAAVVKNIRSEEHTSELQYLMRISYAVFCLKKKSYTDRTQQLLQN